MRNQLHTLFIVCLIAFVHSQSCTFTANDGNFYDLSPLIKKGDQYTFFNKSYGYTYEMNVCANIPGECWPGSPVSASCRVDLQGVAFNYGQASRTTFHEHPDGGSKGVQITYGAGELCNGGTRSTNVIIDCEPGQAEAYIYDVVDKGGCSFQILMKSEKACPTKPHNPCTFTTSDGTYYDLTPLIKTGGQYTFVNPEFGYTYEMNVCADIPKVCWTGLPQSSSCRFSTDLGIGFNYGQSSQTTFSEHPDCSSKGVQIHYGGGENCNGIPRSTTVLIECELGEKGVIYDVIDRGGCSYTILMKAENACPTKPPVQRF